VGDGESWIQSWWNAFEVAVFSFQFSVLSLSVFSRWEEIALLFAFTVGLLTDWLCPPFPLSY
jgi:hypothetical protein